jgi:hypothetical protein
MERRRCTGRPATDTRRTEGAALGGQVRARGGGAAAAREGGGRQREG